MIITGRMLSMAVTIVASVTIAWNIGSFFSGVLHNAMDILLAAVK